MREHVKQVLFQVELHKLGGKGLYSWFSIAIFVTVNYVKSFLEE
jgi:hypothetical protein